MVSVLGLGLIFMGLGVVPAPSRFRAPGLLESVEHRIISAETPGRLEEIVAKRGQTVRLGDPLVRLSNYELELDLQSTQAEFDEAMARRAQAEQEAISDLEPIESRIVAIEKRRAKFENRLYGPLAYVPKEVREEAIKCMEEAEKCAAEACKVEHKKK